MSKASETLSIDYATYTAEDVLYAEGVYVGEIGQRTWGASYLQRYQSGETPEPGFAWFFAGKEDPELLLVDQVAAAATLHRRNQAIARLMSTDQDARNMAYPAIMARYDA